MSALSLFRSALMTGCVAFAWPAFAADGSGFMLTYELVPPVPVAGQPFAVHITYDSSAIMPDNDYEVTVADGVVSVALGLELQICPPILPCPPTFEGTISIPPLAPGRYTLHLYDADQSPPFDATSSFVVRQAPHQIPMLSRIGTLTLLLGLAALGLMIAYRGPKTEKRH